MIFDSENESSLSIICRFISKILSHEEQIYFLKHKLLNINWGMEEDCYDPTWKSGLSSNSLDQHSNISSYTSRGQLYGWWSTSPRHSTLLSDNSLRLWRTSLSVSASYGVSLAKVSISHKVTPKDQQSLLVSETPWIEMYWLSHDWWKWTLMTDSQAIHLIGSEW